ncbi:dephospho-CoA kinase [Campylobacter cuniculorum]|uniref:dephospho-CoA kinase n=1 Tax=Campylobacter cuniculorum TaxID=374106 RepID=UPI0023F217B4|nr:dephospho-CoA kinase [Campylobacter cuniculorum]
MNHTFFVSASIACGKSTFIKIAHSMGFESLSADEIAHEILNEFSNELARLFENPALLIDGKINRKALGVLVFNDKNAKKKLENFMHPKIKERLLEKIHILEQKNKPFFVELPLFFENNNYANLGKSILIYASKEQSLERLMKRENLSKEEALKRIEAQMDIEKKIPLADFVIYNTSTYENFKAECIKFIEKISRGEI